LLYLDLSWSVLCPELIRLQYFITEENYRTRNLWLNCFHEMVSWKYHIMHNIHNYQYLLCGSKICFLQVFSIPLLSDLQSRINKIFLQDTWFLTDSKDVESTEWGYRYIWNKSTHRGASVQGITMIVTPLCISSTYLILLLFVDSLNCQNFNIQYKAKEQAKLGEV